ncbi:MAG: alpha-mannosidase [Cyanobacteria bacterium P01_A01_bin.15]
MNTSTPVFADLIRELRAYSQEEVQGQWRWQTHEVGMTLAQVMAEGSQWEIAPLNERHHIAWPQGTGIWLYQQYRVPWELHGYALEGLSLRLATAWWAESAQLYVNGEFVQAGDLFDFFTRFCLDEAVTPGQSFVVVLRLASPKHDAGALVRSHLIYEAPNHPLSPEPGFVADELQILQSYLQTLAPEKLPGAEAAAAQVWQTASGDLHQRLASLRQGLLPYGDWVKQRRFYCVGHAHLDLAWLWPVADTWQAAERTFRSVLALQQEFPELTYTHSSPALFAWLEANRPELFRQIQQQVAAGTWSIDAGLWVEPELNIVSGESIARQILYGQRYCQEKFGTRSAIAWLPDTFGFCSQLPQLLKLGGVEVFATQKLRWNDTTQFPHELFRWQAPDGSELLGWTLPPIGTDFDPVQMAEYGANWEEKTGRPQVCWLPGVGDHGGGPTRDMLLKARRWQESPFFPEVKFARPGEFLSAALGEKIAGGMEKPIGIENRLAGRIAEKLPLWTDELYLELHRGCYTTHGDQKQQNRRGEDLLYQAEIWATVAQLVAGQPYPQETLETAWKALLFNQFHDILPGSSIPEVFEDANREWAVVDRLGQSVLGAALESVATRLAVSHGMMAIVVFNSHSWTRTEVVDVVVPVGQWRIVNYETNQPVEYSVARHPFDSGAKHSGQTLSFVAEQVPAVGYRLYGLVADPSIAAVDERPTDELVLENDYLRVEIAAETGDILSCIHLATGREIFREAANQLQCFDDSGQYWDAWNIAPDYLDKPCAPARLLTVEWITNTPIRQRLRVTRQLNTSTIVQDYILEAPSPLLRVETWVDWRETQVVLKVNFPVTVASDHGTYEVPFGAIQRSTQPTTEHEKAKWEVPALRWADISDDRAGLSILTDCKHGFDAQPSQLRLTLLKAPLWPDAGCDRTQHHFTYAIYPHGGDWQTARTPHHAQAFNIPLRSHRPSVSGAGVADVALASRSFLSLGPEHLILSAFKPSETEPGSFIARYYDAYGTPTVAPMPLNNSLGLTVDSPLNLLEEPMAVGPSRSYQIHTCRLVP